MNDDENLKEQLISAAKWNNECVDRIESALFELKQAHKEMNDLASLMFNEHVVEGVTQND